MKEKDCGQETVAVGGGLVGCETALWLARQGKKVTIVEVVTQAKASRYEDGHLTVVQNGEERKIPCDTKCPRSEGACIKRCSLGYSFLGQFLNIAVSSTGCQ